MPTAAHDQNGGYYYVQYNINGAGQKTITFNTANKYVADNTVAIINTAAASTPSLELLDNITTLAMGEPSSGVYYPKTNVSGTININNAGWISADQYSGSATNFQVGTVNQSRLSNGNTTIASGTTITPTDQNQIINISEGYNAARTVIVGSASTSSPGSIISGTATINELNSPTYDSKNHRYLFSGSGDISAPSVTTPGYISTTAGTKAPRTDGAQVNAYVNAITLGSTLSGTTTTLKPTLSKQVISIVGVDDAASGTATTTAPSSGAYVAVRSAANTSTIFAAPVINAAGYGTNSNFIEGTNASATIGAAQSDIYYIPIKTGVIESGRVTIDHLDIAYNGTNFTVTGGGNISAPTVSQSGYVSETLGTKNTNVNGASVNTTLSKIAIKGAFSKTVSAMKPVIQKNAATNIEGASNATTTRPSDGYYIAVSSAANTTTVKANATVTTAGYGTTTSGQYATTSSSNATVGAAASDVTYIPITSASFANVATNNVDYTDISNSASALISGSYLFINEGYVQNSKISLAALIPDEEGSDNVPGEYLLEGYSAYTSTGTLVIGTMQTYAGAYTIT